jgi:hypothetical protein
MVSIEEVGDGYIKFVKDGVIVAEVYALANHNAWRFRASHDADFPNKDAAMRFAKEWLAEKGLVE